MKKIITFLLTSACALTITNSSLSMSIKPSFRIKKMRLFCTKTISNEHPLMFKKNELDSLIKDNRALLHEIIEQNKENNELLRIIIRQNFLNSKHLRMYQKSECSGTPLEECTFYNSYQNLKLYDFYNDLERHYTIKIRPNE